MKLIPEFDKNPAIISFFETTVGKITNSLLLAVAFWILGINWWGLAAVGVGLVSFFPSQRRLILLAVSCVYVLAEMNLEFFGNRFSTTQQALSFAELQQLNLVLAWAISLIIAFFILKNKKSASIRNLVILFLIFNGTILGLVYTQGRGWLSLFLWNIVVVFGKIIFPLAYGILERKANKFKYSDLGFLFPAWGHLSSIPKIMGRLRLENIEKTTSQDLAILRIKSLKLLAWVGVLKTIREPLHFLKFGHFEFLPLTLDLPNLGVYASHLSLASINAMSLSTSQTWLVMLLTYSMFLLKIAYFENTFVALARMFGFYLYRASYRPLESKSLNEFFRRAHFYHYELIKEVFFFPFLSLLKFLKTPMRVFCATFLAIIIGSGIQIHVFSFIKVFYAQSLGDLFWRSLPAIIYHILFGVMLSLSVTNELKKGVPKRRNPIKLGALAICYLWILSWVIAWGPEWRIPQFEDQLRYSLKLLGIDI